MNITAENHGSVVVLNLRGELTDDSLAAFAKAVDQELQGMDVVDVVLNMANVPFLDSAALTYLLDLQDRLSERLGQVKLSAIDENIRVILEVTRLKATFDVYDNADEAVRAVSAG